LRTEHPDVIDALFASFARADREKAPVEFVSEHVATIFRIIDRVTDDCEEQGSGRNAIFGQTITDLKFEYLGASKQ